ncbi:acyl-CoA N-acyltransferase [Basidiobolus meristosporus CBS 931.73]|uniref:Acyl-CoA N-acyltransferase n=1 Tax=Basidiobolus meristosporus CBS 931.73 TaxID=1314790 RepID=A0A1Y1YKW9_9FUNG|nr:acyl-CoA N-acyltransferase [Basidiobolus meristosporus CBS 931.73]|eukprot:ORX98639.1 acyl-CoA N-acyltransferase [Basidiobolus meristosporus CBS 931.73]
MLERSTPIEPKVNPLDPEGPKVLKVTEDLEDTKENQNLVGFCGLNHINWADMQTSMGIILHHPFQGKGYATEALYLMLWYGFELLHLHRLVVETTEDNKGMRGWMENLCGVKVESVCRESIRLNATTWLDSWNYSILEHEWRSFVKDRLETKLGWRASVE